MERMTEVHRHILQMMMAHKFMAEDELTRKLEDFKNNFQYETLVQNNSEERFDIDLSEFITTINSALNFMDMKIVREQHPKTKKILYTLINQTEDEISKLATRYSIDELELFKSICEAIANDNDEILTIVVATSKRPKALSVEAAEQAIRLFIEEGWLENLPGQGLKFGFRSQTDLANYISELQTLEEEEEPQGEEEEEE
ncbi:non-SMC element 1 [Naegleria gruberi]|uniref:Non-structural maintenance of chromosomes element 1 homolog n=1 Tax=Naegleria gruberi TaxID=5762 RepID=D2V2K3_NAEGR|nr:non-SMC element 1 [Naegleria gruberi]EFC48911.1 non-SMC element 1 [Naegleria gruberi]|eukprot:XP_002681655.1 non-SMC element 1 [Naegleria gruberi strain NEG-M]